MSSANRPHRLDAFSCSHCYVLLVDRRDVTGERDRSVESNHRDVLRDDL
jgi:hypothetical protein